MECPLLNGNMEKETDTETDKCMYKTLGGCVIPARLQLQITLLMTVNSIVKSLPSNYFKDLTVWNLWDLWNHWIIRVVYLCNKENSLLVHQPSSRCPRD